MASCIQSISFGAQYYHWSKEYSVLCKEQILKVQ